MTLKEFTGEKDVKGILAYILFMYKRVLNEEPSDLRMTLDIQDNELNKAFIATDRANLRLDQSGITVSENGTVDAQIPLDLCEDIYKQHEEEFE